jgi:hypothetical protein
MKKTAVSLFVLALVACSSQQPMTTAGGCKTPMPASLPIDTTAPSPAQAAYLGMWEGNFTGPAGVSCGRLAVQHINADGSVQLTWANESFTVSRGAGNPPLVYDANSLPYVGHLDGTGLHYVTNFGTNMEWQLKGADLDGVAHLQSGSTATAVFKRQQ